ncbi:radical SAM protein [Streptomyces sp. WELS2]|uniref:B12-binding domain-containing radical SAM protein n=1 Tax=Streptomyces sp. WELS2 TaxID=2749435 RepID=UPI0015EFEDD6|nr:B12-binding domain-containing radical SAM protein [Streptomyces sp. WELS2]
MKVAIVSYFDSLRFDEYPITHSLGAMRLGAYLRTAHPEWEVRLRAFDERGYSAPAAAAALLAEGFDVVGVPAYLWTLERAGHLAERLCAGAGAPLVVCGGPETRAMDYSRWPQETVHVMGQGEEPLLWLCERRAADPAFTGRTLEADCAQPVYSASRDRIRAYRYAVPDRADRSLPQGAALFSPEFDAMLDGDRVDTDFAWYETARGCIYDCSFCGHNTLPFFATFDTDFVRAEIRNMRERGIRRIFLIDPILGGKAARGKEILRAFRDLAPEISLTAYMRPEFLDDEFVELLVESNIHELLMGLQTTNPNVPKHVRGNHFEKIMRFVPHLAARGVPWRAELIVGLPGDDMNGLRESLRFTIDELRPWSVHSYHLTAIPETKLFELLDRTEDDIWIKADDRLRVVSASSFDERELRDMLVYAGGVTSRHSHLRERDGTAPGFDVLDRDVRAALADPVNGRAAAAAFITMGHPAGHQVWREHSGAPLGAGT